MLLRLTGDAEAFIWLMEENKHMLYKIAKGYFRTWLTRILINKCMDILRKEKRFTDLREFPEQTYTNKEFQHLEFCQTLDMLPEESRIIFLLYYGERFTTREIADTLEINENTVKARLRRGRKYLAKKLGYKSGEV
ncbi:MAG: RNA polymerase sigma factor [Clostridiales bacterium]|nr:RNA polymerase sigma factor [Clostridiales bacterium]